MRRGPRRGTRRKRTNNYSGFSVSSTQPVSAYADRFCQLLKRCSAFDRSAVFAAFFSIYIFSELKLLGSLVGAHCEKSDILVKLKNALYKSSEKQARWLLVAETFSFFFIHASLRRGKLQKRLQTSVLRTWKISGMAPRGCKIVQHLRCNTFFPRCARQMMNRKQRI